VPATGTELIERTRRFMGDYPETDTTTDSIGAGDTLTVAATASDRYHLYQMLQVEDEVMMVKSLPSGSPTEVVVKRGLRGTSSATHASGTTILTSPRFFDIEYLDALNYGIQACWPHIYKPMNDDSSLKFTTDTYEYTIPEFESRNELSEANSRFESGIGTWLANPGGNNTFAVSGAQEYEGSQSGLATYQNHATSASLEFTATAAVEHLVSMRVYIPSAAGDFSGTALNLQISAFGNNNVQQKAFDLTKTDQWQYADLIFTPLPTDLVGTISLVNTGMVAADFVYVDDVRCGRRMGAIRHLSRVEVKVPGGQEWLPRRRWSVRRGGVGANGASENLIVFQHLDTVGSSIRLSGFGPFPSLNVAADVLDTQWPIMAEYPLVEFAASYLMESGEARRVTVDRGLVDQREQANRVGASMQASQALLNRFERRMAAVAMPPMAGYPHVNPFLG